MKKTNTKNNVIQLTASEKRFRVTLIVSAFVLFSLVLFAFIYLSTTPEATATMLLSFFGGISNIVLPCTLPLVFIIVPLAMVAGGRKGLLMSILFGLGLIITLAVYGAVVGFLGQFLGLDKATRIMYSLAGLASLFFGFIELKLLTFQLPSYARMPKFIEKQGDYLKVFFLGLLLGNAGIGCPNPITYVVLTFAATTGDWLRGSLLMAMNGLGRMIPLLLLTILGILGINTISWLTKKTEAITKFTGWALVVLGSFILLNGVFGHLWYEGGLFHEGLNAAFMAAGGKTIGEADIEIGEIEKPVAFSAYGALINLLLTTLPVFWYWRKYPKNRKGVLLILFIIILWDILLFDFGFNAMNWLGLQ
ncbi:sulfite exporter TauE/SafE family protein [Candidatus Woesearchaeota archaeon]|nr:sulfite exporter TauE/SafE family protein [Candidatus Woesearchaeota archaeon]